MRFRAVYGGQRWIEAETEWDAYQQLWDWLRAQLDAGELGLVIPVEDEEGEGE